MSFIKLCEPKLDCSADAIMDRLAALERAAKNGSIATEQVKV